MNVTVLVIEHEYGTNISAHTTEKAAKADLRKFLDSYWKTDGPGGPMPDDTDAAAEDYFSVSGERFIIETVQVEE